MPYITHAQRKRLHQIPITITNAGELNYVITRILLNYLQVNDTRYQTINDCVGVLECAKLEMYRRLVAGYEDGKIAENGDVYE